MAAAALGIHEVHCAMVAIFAMGLGLFTPPFGVGFYAACAIGKVAPDQAIGRVWPHLGGAVHRADRDRRGAVDFDRVPLDPLLRVFSLSSA